MVFRSVAYFVLVYLVRYITNSRFFRSVAYFVLAYLVRYFTNYYDLSLSGLLCSCVFSSVCY